MGITLASIPRLDISGFAAPFRDQCYQIFNTWKKKIGNVPLSDGLYTIKPHNKSMFVGLVKGVKTLTIEEVHVWLGYIAPSSMWQMLLDGSIIGITLDETESTIGTCKSFKYGKTVWKPIDKIRDLARHEALGNEVHTNLWGPSTVETSEHHHYYVSFIDNHTHFIVLYLQKMKSETYELYHAYKA